MTIQRCSFLTLLASLAAGPTVAETFDIELFNFRFEPNELTIAPGDTVRWTNRQGFHDVQDDAGNFGLSAAQNAPWEFEMTFNEEGEIRYHCSVHSAPGRDITAFMNGRIIVQGSGGPTIDINQGIAGAWFDPATAGQGFLIDVEPASNFIFVAWFTYEAAGGKVGAPEHRWLTAQGNYTGGTASLDLFVTSGGRFDDPQGTSTASAGSMDISFSDCSNGSISYNLTDDNLSGQIDITRVVAGTEALCQSLLSN